MTPTDRTKLTPKLVSGLYTEAMRLADEARTYFDGAGKDDREGLGPVERVAFSCESLRVTTRLMHTVSWLLVRKAIAAGEMTEAEAAHPDRRLGSSGDDNPDAGRLEKLPPRARAIVDSSRDLYNRVKRLDEQLVQEVQPSPARALLGKLEQSL